jgi:GTPase SAR1 family protein
LASKKGVGLTVAILVAITIASFFVWLVPQRYDAAFVVSDFKSHLYGVKEIHLILVDGTEKEFQKMLSGEITPDQYIEIAEISSSQINSQIIQLVESNASEEWQESYLNYIEALRATNSSIRETIVVANRIKDSADKDGIEQILEKIEQLKEESKSFVSASDSVRP